MQALFGIWCWAVDYQLQLAVSKQPSEAARVLAALRAACLRTVTELQLWSRKSFIIISHLFCLPNYLINSVVLIALFTVCFVEA